MQHVENFIKSNRQSFRPEQRAALRDAAGHYIQKGGALKVDHCPHHLRAEFLRAVQMDEIEHLSAGQAMYRAPSGVDLVTGYPNEEWNRKKHGKS